jgi:HSP20 family protein
MTMIKLSNKYPFLFENFFNESDHLPKVNHGSIPAVNILENADEFQLELAAPGFKKEDFKINFQGNKLTISAEKSVENEAIKLKYNKKEFDFSKIARSFTLPQSVEIEAIVANYEAGILKVSIPKKEEAKIKEPKIIEVQ